MGEIAIDEAKQLNKMTTKFMNSGEYSKAMGIVSAGCKQLKRTNQLYDCLQSKHPAQAETHLTNAQLDQLLHFSLDVELEHQFKNTQIRQKATSNNIQRQ